MASLIEHQQIKVPQNEGVDEARLRPLLDGKAVALVVKDVRIHTKKRVTLPLLFLTPGSLYGLHDVLVISFWGNGCEVAQTNQEIRPVVFHRLGITGKDAVVLARALSNLYHSEVIEANGNTQTKQRGKKQPQK